MKNLSVILKVLAVIAAIVGIIYLIATYGDRIVAWFKRLVGKKTFADECEEFEDEECRFDCTDDEDFDE